MSDYRAIIERDLQRVGPAGFSFVDLARRRARRLRNRRLGTIALALVIAVLVVGGSIRALHRSLEQKPANHRITSDNAKDLKLAWSASLDGTPPNINNRSLQVDRVYPPTIADGIVFVGSDAGTLFAFDAACGEGGVACSPMWIADVSGEISDPPTVADGVVYVSANGGGLFAFPERCGSGGATCEPLWTANTGRAIASPVVVGGIVYGIDPVGGTVYAFRAGCGTGGQTCTPLWTAPTERSRSNAQTLKWVDFRPAVSDGVVYALGKGKDDRVYALDAVTGRLLWTAASPPPGTGSISPYDTPVVAGGLVLVLAGGEMQAFSVGCRTDGGQCRPTWVHHGDTPPVVVGDVVLSKTFTDFTTGGMEAYGLHCGTGGETCMPIWSAIDGGWGDFQDGPDVGDGVIVSTAYRGEGSTIHVFPVKCQADCSATWTASLPEPRDATVSGDVVFIPTADGNLYGFAVDCETGGGACTPVWTARGISAQASQPVVDGDRLFVSTLDGKLLAFAPPSAVAPAATRRSSASTFVFYIALAVAAAILLFVRARRRTSRSGG